MKKILLTALVVSSLVACENIVGGVRTERTDSAKAEMSLTPVQRDNSITAANAYSDIFLDSVLVDEFIKKQALNDTMALQLRNFYNARNYQFAWLASDGFTEQGRGFWNLYDYHSKDSALKKFNDTLFNKKLDTLLETDSLYISANDSNFVKTELALTQQFIQYINDNNDSTSEHLQQFIPVRKTTVRQLADSILNIQDSGQSLTLHTDSIQIFTANQQYSLLKDALRKYDSIADKGGWQPILSTGNILKKGVSAPAVTALKKRLQLSGDMPGKDTSQTFNDSLDLAIKNFQQRHGQKPDGIVSDSLISIMNVPVEERIKQILVNMNRIPWMPVLQQARLIQVNVPDYMMHVYEDTEEVFNSKVIVGKEGTNTMMFTGNMNQIVFNPYWNIPASIVQNEIMPAMKKDPNYLKKNNMEIVHQNDSLPVIRQLPGPQNPLGKVKFLFPNSYEIYFHDSPNKYLFDQRNRAFSHGCIRIAEAQKLAEYLLKNNPEWTVDKIQATMKSGKEQAVSLKDQVPVSITYLTAWVDPNGQVNFRNDIYGHDARTASKMFNG
ncbi:L,D-transpeptidase family protein [Chitinophagaceae bacterium LB-8]|uniref:L,D-transpeptidase family protein n=1 Tax=Paraflavisolibacter caeni TaxID=2982496 RepID=A0A9X2XW32_9BACT|nr:L,D-transpeptidase family protein [Paraflavisolibacter caeni]MCU7550286.1 L,D-transpeptidase family protein [Paraflavisolibacter caeni]